MVPKIIHYCWFGGNKLPNSAKRCIASWKKFMPGYEIKEWNEENFDINCCEYVKEAYQAKKWAFVSDYARFWILYNYGGLYFDTDVEIIKDIKPIVNKGAFMGCESIDSVAPGLGLGALPHSSLYKEILDYYESVHFIFGNGKIPKTVVEHTTKILCRHGWNGNGEIKKIDGIYIYPPEYFCPMDYHTGKFKVTENTYTIHWYTASWQSAYSKLKTHMQHMAGKNVTGFIKKLKSKFKK